MILRLKNKINMIALICILGITIIFSILNISVVTALSKSKIDASLSSNMNYLIDLLDAKYPGSFSVQDGNLFKGDTNLSNPQILSHLKSKTGLEYTLFCMDTRINTTIGNGTIIGTKCEGKVFAAAKKGDTYKHNLTISDTNYATYYSPIKDDAGEVIGMYFLGENLRPYTQSVYNNLLLCFVVTILALVISIICTNIFSQTISTPIGELLDTLNRIKGKNFTSTFNHKLASRKDEIGDLSRGLMSMQQTISNILIDINQISSYIKTDSSSLSTHAKEMSVNSEKIVTVTQEIAANTTKQANEILSIDNTINVLASNIEFISSLILGINSNSHDISALSTEANKNMQTTTDSMASFNDSFTCFTGKIEDLSSNINKVNKITTVIHSISKQTNLLALNAAIEASRAGDSGKSFAVVAEQIRALAVQSQQSAESISIIVSNLLTASNQLSIDTTKMSTIVDEQIHNVTTNITNFSKIIEDLDKMIPDINRAYTYTSEITKQKEHIVRHIDNISVTAQNISAACEEVASSAKETNNVVGELNNSSSQLNKISNTLNSNFESFKLN